MIHSLEKKIALSARTLHLKKNEVDETRQFFYVRPEKMPVWGRVLTTCSDILQGKCGQLISNHNFMGDYLIISNLIDIKFSSDKEKEKVWERYTGFHGGLRQDKFVRDIHKIYSLFRRSLKCMLPKNKQSKDRLSRVIIIDEKLEVDNWFIFKGLEISKVSIDMLKDKYIIKGKVK